MVLRLWCERSASVQCGFNRHRLWSDAEIEIEILMANTRPPRRRYILQPSPAYNSINKYQFFRLSSSVRVAPICACAYTLVRRCGVWSPFRFSVTWKPSIHGLAKSISNISPYFILGLREWVCFYLCAVAFFPIMKHAFDRKPPKWECTAQRAGTHEREIWKRKWKLLFYELWNAKINNATVK